MKIYERSQAEYETELQRLAVRGDADLASVEAVVDGILTEVATQGDAALMAITERVDGRKPEPLVYTQDDCLRARSSLEPELLHAMEHAASRIRAFHEHQLAQEQSRTFTDAEGVTLGWRVRPLSRVGVYVPGGKARYPSSVLMGAIPAQVAGVGEIVITTPRPTPDVLAAASFAGVHRVYDLGGAVAVAALAYGTQSVGRVDKIVGPGNLYVTAAKRRVFGRVAIDGLAGPSEILVVADDGANPEVAAADLLSQAEHDEAAYPLLVTWSRAQADAIVRAVETQLQSLPRNAIASVSVRNHGRVFVVGDASEAARVATLLAAEHLALLVRDPHALFARIGAAGAVFLGDYTPEAAGDYLAGPSHVLPTGGAVRFASPLGVYDFLVRSSVIHYSAKALSRHASSIVALAEREGLHGHARAVTVRVPSVE